MIEHATPRRAPAVLHRPGGAAGLRVGIVAGESSGDQLGAAVIEELLRERPGTSVFGMAGPRMIEAGCRATASTAELSVMGLVEVLRRYPSLWRLRERLVADFTRQQPDVFVGIDVPDFVLAIERRLKQAGIPTAHLVAPQVWAWRPGRARRLGASCDRLLCLFPFEEEFFRGYGVDARFIGHPLTDSIVEPADPSAARSALGLTATGPCVALLPGSRAQERRRLGPLFFEAARRCAERRGDLQFVAAAMDADGRAELERLHADIAPGLELKIAPAGAHAALAAADVALAASGTVTLEALLSATPVVVAYRLAPLSFAIMRRLATVSQIAMPNILAGRAIVPEFVQDDATPDALAGAVLAWLSEPDRVRDYRAAATAIRASLGRHAARAAARAIVEIADAGR